MVKHAVKPLFYGMNITEPAQYSSIGQHGRATRSPTCKFGRKPISAYTDARHDLAEARAATQLRTFYEGIRTQYGTGK